MGCGTWAAAGLAALAGAAAEARQTSAEPRTDGPTLGFVWENDSFGGTDRNYTNGVRLSYVTRAEPASTERFGLAALVQRGDNVVTRRRSFALGHSIFTPRDIEAVEPLPDQHPYAGYAYGEYAEVYEQEGRLHQFTVQLGIVGPSAGGEALQNNYHALIGGEEARGWDNQIDDEVGVTLSYDGRRRTVLDMAIPGGLDFDITPNVGVSVGNVRINGRAGLTARLGVNLAADYGPPRVRPALAGAGFFQPGAGPYVFAGIQGVGVVHDIFLDGSLFRDGDPSVDSKAGFFDAQGGLAVTVGKTRFAYTYVYRSEEFDGQDGPQIFGAASLSRRF